MEKKQSNVQLHTERNTNHKLGNTLDYYKENLPLDVVGKLMHKDNSYKNFINKYNNDNEVELPHQKIRTDAEEEFLNDFQNTKFDYAVPKSSLLRTFMSVLFVIFLCVIAVLLFKINSLNHQLTDAMQHINENAEAKEKLQTVLIENEDLKKTLADIQNPKQTTPVAVEQPEPQTTESSAPDKTSPSTTQTYVVKPGDTLSSISSKFYGNPNQYDKIIKKNGLKADSLNENQKLIIP